MTKIMLTLVLLLGNIAGAEFTKPTEGGAMSNKKYFDLLFKFDSDDARQDFIAWFLDGGGEYSFNDTAESYVHFNFDDIDKEPNVFLAETEAVDDNDCS